jgi:glutamine amidotransferase-like uncharacterized protein
MGKSEEILIYLYGDDNEGANEDCVENTYKWLNKHLEDVTIKSNIKHKIQIITADDILSGILKKEKPEVLIFPGGNAKEYVRLLQGKGVENIREFVADGGIYQGTCAGKTFASDIFYCHNKKTDEKITHNSRYNETIGATFITLAEPDQYLTPEQISKGVQVIVGYKIDGEERRVQVYYNKGAYIKDGEGLEEKARYKDIYPEEVAVAEVDFGNGKVIVSGVHPEMDVYWLNEKGIEAKSEQIYNNPDIQQESLDEFSREIVLKQVIKRYIELDNQNLSKL